MKNVNIYNLLMRTAISMRTVTGANTKPAIPQLEMNQKEKLMELKLT